MCSMQSSSSSVAKTLVEAQARGMRRRRGSDVKQGERHQHGLQTGRPTLGGRLGWPGRGSAQWPWRCGRSAGQLSISASNSNPITQANRWLSCSMLSVMSWDRKVSLRSGPVSREGPGGGRG